MGGLETILYIPAMILAGFLGILALLTPWFVYRIYKATENQNKLLRQLIRAYGHEPEA